MPTRLLRDGILHSERVDQLTHQAEVFYRRLMSAVDDHGLFDARLSRLRATLYPLRIDRTREADISRWLAECQKARLIVLYESEGKPYLKMLDTNWTVRSQPKFPAPNGEQLKATANNCKQLLTYSESETKSNTERAACAAFSDEGVGEIPKALDTEAFRTIWKEWVAYRRKLKSPKDWPGLWRRQLEQLAEWGEAGAIQSLRRALVSGWASFHEPRGMGTPVPGSTMPQAAPVAPTTPYNAERIKDACKAEIEKLRADGKSYDWDGGIKGPMKQEVREQILKLRGRIDAASKAIAGVTA